MEDLTIIFICMFLVTTTVYWRHRALKAEKILLNLLRRKV